MALETRTAVINHIRRELMEDRPDFDLTDETNLLKEHIIDSLGIFLLITFLEEQYGIAIDADEVLVENFETIPAVVQLVESKRNVAEQAKTA